MTQDNEEDIQKAGEMTELSELIKEIGEKLTAEYHEKFAAVFCELEAPIPIEIWAGIAQALADASGYRIVVQASVVDVIDNKAGYGRIVGYRDVISAEPTLFLTHVFLSDGASQPSKDPSEPE